MGTGERGFPNLSTLAEAALSGREEIGKAENFVNTWTTEALSQCHLLSDCESQAIGGLATS